MPIADTIGHYSSLLKSDGLDDVSENQKPNEAHSSAQMSENLAHSRGL